MLFILYAYKAINYVCVVLCRLEGVEARLQETSEAFEQSRLLAKRAKSEYERVKKTRSVGVCTFICTCFKFTFC